MPDTAPDPFANLAVVEVPSFGSSADDRTPGEKVQCELCGKLVTVTQKGELRQHKCVGDREPPGRRKGAKAPAPVHKVLDAFAAGAIEWGSAKYLERAIPTEYALARAATDMGNEVDALIKPPIDAIWPTLPKSVQKSLIKFADHSDLIACAFAWSDYFARLKAFTEWERQRQATTVGEGVAQNGYQGETFPDGFQPFRPVNEAI